MALSEQTRAHIQQILDQHPIVLFMKGSKQQPRCGFSAQVVSILDGYGVDYRDIDVLSDPSLRDGIKEFGNWPTIPQLYFRGGLVGGCDIVRQLDESGELLPAIGIDPAAGAPSAPDIKLDAAALAAIREASGEAEPGQHLRMEIRNAGRSVDLYFDAPRPTDVRVERDGLVLLFDRASARLANGLSIEYVTGPNGGFKIDNPNVPGRVRNLAAPELKKLLDQNTPLYLFDVRGDTERAVARIEQARSFDDAARAELARLPKDAMLIFHCHHGRRSQAAAEYAVQQGFRNVWNLTGGIDAWSAQVDPRVARY